MEHVPTCGHGLKHSEKQLQVSSNNNNIDYNRLRKEQNREKHHRLLHNNNVNENRSSRDNKIIQKHLRK